jgi:hypothetical protein
MKAGKAIFTFATTVFAALVLAVVAMALFG